MTPGPTAPTVPAMRRYVIPFVVVGALMVLIAALFSVATPSPGEQAAAAGRERDQRAQAMGAYGTPASATTACHEKVRDQLRSPTSATFAAPDVQRAGARWSVAGAVDADNALGATLRTSYRCTVVESAGGAVEVVATLEQP